MTLEEIAQQAKEAGITAEQIAAAMAKPPAKGLVAPVPDFTVEQWSEWLAALTPGSGEPDCMAVYKAVQAGDGPGAYAALIGLWRQITAAKPELEHLHAAEVAKAQETK